MEARNADPGVKKASAESKNIASEDGRFCLSVVSVGPGDAALVPPMAAEVLRLADYVFVAQRNRLLVEEVVETRHGSFDASSPSPNDPRPFAETAKTAPRLIVMKSLDETTEQIAESLWRGNVAVAVSGDAGLFSYQKRLRERFRHRIRTVPGISSMQTLLAKVGETWEDAKCITVHGQNMSPAKIAGTVACNPKTVVFCGPDRGPSWLCRIFAERGMDNLDTVVGERLSYPDERVVAGHPSDIAGQDFDALSLVYIFNSRPLSLFAARPRDRDFARGEGQRGTAVPMTRGEVRGIILDRLELSADSVVWDIGAGTGSVSATCALAVPYGDVFAVERLPAATELLRVNREKFGLHNLWIYQNNATEILNTLPRPDRVFVGGSGGELRQILEHIRDRGDGIRVVVSGVTLKTICLASEVLSGEGFADFDVVQIAVAQGKSVGGSLIMTAQNPVTLLSATTAGTLKDEKKAGRS